MTKKIEIPAKSVPAPNLTQSDKQSETLDQTLVHEKPELGEPNVASLTNRADDQTLIAAPDTHAKFINSNPKEPTSKRSQPPVGRSQLVPKQSSSSQPSNAKSVSDNSSRTDTPQRLGGYKIIKMLGEGGMGAVYLAKQLSLDRSVALKTIQTQWSTSPRVVARFIREAYAAAQLTHHNVVQIYDLGEEGGTNFFSMELVGGGSLEELLKQKGILPPKMAATLILQAARGLKFAHDHGMVHRDIKPANLMLTSDGMLKVADLGLVKTPSMDDSLDSTSTEDANLMLASARSNVTYQGSTMGTPAYMSPEQADDASSVDHRADIYSLGCTFYALITGKPPFVSDTIIELLSKHKVERIPRPESIITNLPGALGDIIDKMTAKRPEDRYQDMQFVIGDIESFLGLADSNGLNEKSSGPQNTTSQLRSETHPISSNQSSEITSVPVSHVLDSPSGQSTHASKIDSPNTAIPLANTILQDRQPLLAEDREIVMLEKSSKDFAASPLRFLQQMAPIILLSICIFFSFIFLFQSLTLTLLIVLVGLFTPVFTLLVSYHHGQSILAQRFVHSARMNSVADWAYILLGCLLLAITFYVLGLWGTIIASAIISALVGVGYFYVVDKPLTKARTTSILLAHSAMKLMRSRGLCEEDIHYNVNQVSGLCKERWLEAIVGYEQTNDLLKNGTKSESLRSQFTWSSLLDISLLAREYCLQRTDERLKELQTRNDRKLLAKVERASLIASGASSADATRQAVDAADALVEVAQETKRALVEIHHGKFSDEDAAAKRNRIKRMLQEAKVRKSPKKSLGMRTLELILSQLLGGKMRFTLGAFLLAGFALWAQQNHLFSNETIVQATRFGQEVTGDSGTAIDRATAAMTNTKELAATLLRSDTKPLAYPVIGNLFQNFAPAFAGIILILSSIFAGWRMSLALIPAAAIIMIGPSLGVPSLGSLASSQSISIVAGILIAVTGGWILRNR